MFILDILKKIQTKSYSVEIDQNAFASQPFNSKKINPLHLLSLVVADILIPGIIQYVSGTLNIELSGGQLLFVISCLILVNLLILSYMIHEANKIILNLDPCLIDGRLSKFLENGLSDPLEKISGIRLKCSQKTMKIHQINSRGVLFDINTDYNIHNSRKDIFDTYMYTSKANSTHPPEDYAIYIDNLMIPPNPDNNRQLVWIDPQTVEIKEYLGLQITIPVCIRPETDRNLRINERNYSTIPPKGSEKFHYDNITPLKISETISYPTTILKLGAHLDPSCPPNSFLAKTMGEYGHFSSFFITDSSNQRQMSIEMSMIESNEIPLFSEDKRVITWKIPHPLLGYTYHLCFSLNHE